MAMPCVSFLVFGHCDTLGNALRNHEARKDIMRQFETT